MLSRKPIAILGTGAMGSRVASNLLAAGYEVAVFNRNRARAEPLVAKGARLALKPCDAAEGAAVAIALVRDDAASQEVWLGEAGALHVLPPSAVAIESSTLSTSWIDRLATKMQAAAAMFIDVPLIGSRPQAEAKALIAFAGGDSETLARVFDILSVSCATIHHTGPVGSATALKLAVNGFFATQVAAMAELAAISKRHGIEPERSFEIVSGLPTTSAAAKGAGALMLANDISPLFPIELVEKDLGYALDAARAHALEPRVLRSVHELFAQARRHGFGSANVSAVSAIIDCAATSLSRATGATQAQSALG